jgi:site-specific recombinase XerD
MGNDKRHCEINISGGAEMRDNLFTKQLGEYFDIFLPDVNGASKNTIAAYGDSFAVLFQFLDEKKNLPHHLVTYKHFTVALLDEFLIWMKNDRGYSASTIRQRMTALTSFMKYASRREMRALNAFTITSSTELPKAVQSEFPYFTQEETALLLSLPDPKKYLGTRDLVFLSFMYDTAARADEMCKALVSDIKFGTPTKVKLHGKGNKTREVPVSDEVANLLRYHFKEQRLQDKDSRALPLFLSQSNKRMTTSCVRSIVKKYVEMAKSQNPMLFTEESYSPHSFRHSKAIHMVESGVNLIYIRNFLGHVTVSSTEIYARVGQAAVTKALTERKIPRIASSVPKEDRSQSSLPDFINRARKIM